MADPILVETQDVAIVIRFNRPEIRSPLSVDVLETLDRILEDAVSRSDVSALIFTGVDNVFASGADLREIARVDQTTAADFARRGQTIMNQISDIRVPTIAAINGVCFGGALDLALSCGRRIASPNATFAHPGADLGIMTGWGGTQRLPRLVGEARALEMFFTTRRIGAEEALQMGLVDKVDADPVRSALEFISDRRSDT